MVMLTASSKSTSSACNLARWHSSSTFPMRIELPRRATTVTFRRRFDNQRKFDKIVQSTRCLSTTAITRQEHDLNNGELRSNPPVTNISASQSLNPEHAARLARNEYGDRLPNNVLSEEALDVYRRLYGDPLPPESEAEKSNELQSKDESGQWESITSRLNEGESFKYELVEDEVDEDQEDEDGVDEDDPDVEAEGDDLFNMDPDYVRTHPFTIANRFGTSPKTLEIPHSAIVKPIADMLAATATTKNLEVATQRVFGGLGLPYSPSTPSLSRTMPQRPVAMSAQQSKMPSLDADSYLIGIYPHAYASISSALVEVRKRLGSQWLRNLLNKDGGPLVLDAGAAGAGALAWRDVARAEWNAMQDEGGKEPAQVNTIHEGDLTKERDPMPPGKMTVVVGSDTLRHRAAKLLDSTTFIPRLPDAVPFQAIEGASPRKQYDVVLAPYSLWRLEKEFDRKYHVQTLWSLLKPEGGILILLEKGVPRGFEVIAAAREHLLKRHIANQESVATASQPEEPQSAAEFGATPIQKEAGMIIAPCTNHSACPLYQTAGLGRGRKDYCHFSQRFIRPSFLQSALGARRRNHEDVEFSYIAVQRGQDLRMTESDNYLQGDAATDRALQGYGPDQITSRTQDIRERKARPHAQQLDNNIFADAAARSTSTEEAAALPPPHSLALPRLILPPLKRKGHIVLDVCTPSATFERWIVTRRNGKQAYRDARKAKWGDLWALGAKTREPRRKRVGTVEKADKGFKKSSRGRRKKEIRDILEDAGLIDE